MSTAMITAERPRMFRKERMWKSAAEVMPSREEPIVTWMTDTGAIPMKQLDQNKNMPIPK